MQVSKWVILGVIIVVIAIVAVVASMHRGVNPQATPSAAHADPVKYPTEQYKHSDTLAENIVVPHPATWTAAQGGSGMKLAVATAPATFTVAPIAHPAATGNATGSAATEQTQSLSVGTIRHTLESGAPSSTLAIIKKDKGAAWREATVAGAPGIEIGSAPHTSDSDVTIRFDYYNDALAQKGETLVIVITNLTTDQLTKLKAAGYDPYAVLSTSDLIEVRNVVAQVQLPS
jgi:hypothetical protein